MFLVDLIKNENRSATGFKLTLYWMVRKHNSNENKSYFYLYLQKKLYLIQQYYLQFDL